MRRPLKIVVACIAAVLAVWLMFATRNTMMRWAVTHEGKQPQMTAPASPPPTEATATLPVRAPAYQEQITHLLQNMHPGQARKDALLAHFLAWAKTDAKSALTWAESFLEGQERGAAFAEGLRNWAAQDISTAAQWVSLMAADDTHTQALQGLMQVWAKNDPVAALVWLSQLPPNRSTDEAAETIARTWAAADFEKASQWAALQSASGALTPAGIAIVRGLAEAAPRQSAQWASTLPASSARAEVLADVMAQWATQEPAQAAIFLANTAEDTPAAFSAVANNWAKSDAAGASAWIATQPEGPIRDASIEGFASALAPYDMPSAMAWANSVSAEDARAKLSKSLLEFWMSDNPEAALEYIKQSSQKTAAQEP